MCPLNITHVILLQYTVQNRTDEIQKFSIKGFDKCGDPIYTNKIKWSASNNQIDKDGEFKADHINREVRISASLKNVTCSVVVKILIYRYFLI